MAELHLGDALIGEVTGVATMLDGRIVIRIRSDDGLTREVIIPRPPTWLERMDWLEKQAEYQATLEAFDRLHARRERRRALRWLRPWPLASAGYWDA